MNKYESVFIIDTVLDNETTQDLVNKFADFINKNGASVKKVDKWGKKKMSYPIKKRAQGYYTEIEFEAQGDFVEKLEREFKLNEYILRYLVIKLDKKAIEYKEAQRVIAMKEKEKLKAQKTKENPDATSGKEVNVIE
jgi:small subunit ribosomal protein S6